MLLSSAKFLLFLGSILIGFSNTNGAKIICLFNMPSRSHYVLGESLLIGLAERGHEVTMVAPYKLSKPIPNYKEIYLDEALKYMMENNPFGSNFFEARNEPVYKMVSKMLDMGIGMTNHTLYHPGVQDLIKSGAKFDILIAEVFMNEALFGLAHQFGAIPVGFSTIQTTKWTNEMLGNPDNPAYNPSVFLGYTPNMNYWQRMINTVMAVLDDVLYSNNVKNQDALYKHLLKHVSPGVLPDLDVILKNVSLVLLNTHVAVGYPRSNVPNMVDVAGIHIKEGGKLPKDLQNFIDSAKDGVIYFAMGGNLRSVQLPVEKREALLKVFGKLKQKVIWKWEDEVLPGKPDNVFIGSWMPQQSILAHPNVKCFITHGGGLSTIEAVYFGVPLVGIPILGDQYLNMAKAVSAGYGVQVTLDDLTEETLSSALNTVLTDSRFTAKAESLSKILRDEPMTALQRAVYHVEYILRHKGAPFLRSPSLNLSTCQTMLLDVVGGLAVILATLLAIPFFIIRTICRKVCNKKTKSNKKKKTN